MDNNIARPSDTPEQVGAGPGEDMGASVGPGCEASPSAADGVFAESHPSRDGSALLWFPERRGWLLLRENGEVRFIDRTWMGGAKIAFAGAHIKGLIAYLIITWLDTGDPGGWRWRLLPSYGDWAYRNDHGRLSSLARFIDVDLTLWPRSRDSDGSGEAGETGTGSIEDDSAVAQPIAHPAPHPDPQSKDSTHG